VAVQVWTVDEAAEMERLLDMGLHAVMTDRPSVLREVMRARGAWGA
jgi:glycerophosphoryl diester phosphodiesterase